MREHCTATATIVTVRIIIFGVIIQSTEIQDYTADKFKKIQ